MAIDLGAAEELSTGVAVSVIHLGGAAGALVHLSLGGDLATVGLDGDELAALARWVPDDWQLVTDQRLYLLLRLAVGGLRAQGMLRAEAPARLDGDGERDTVLLYIPPLPLPDAMILARLAAVARREGGDGRR